MSDPETTSLAEHAASVACRVKADAVSPDEADEWSVGYHSACNAIAAALRADARLKAVERLVEAAQRICNRYELTAQTQELRAVLAGKEQDHA